MFKLLVLLLLVNCVFAEKEEITSEKCNEMFEPHRDNIFFCCDTVEPEVGKCRSVCTENDGNCSCANCLKENNFVPREKDQFLMIYDRDLNEKFTAEEKENWLPVLNKSFEHCKPLMDILNETHVCQVPKYFQPMVVCMWHQNFVNCPQLSIVPSEKCNATRKFIKEQETCGTKYENIFVIDDSIFDQDTEQKNKCKEIFKKAELKSKSCVYFTPQMIPSRDVYDGCKKQCSTKVCCMAPCFLNATSADNFGKEFVKNKIDDFYESYFKENGIYGLHDIWKPVIESSFGICYELASNVSGTRICNIRLKFDSLFFCMRQELFLSAPKSLIHDPDQFEKIKTFIGNETKCGQKFGEKFIIDSSFWKN